MTKDISRDDVLRPLLKTPPKPHAQVKAKGKPSPFPPTTKAERAALKRIDKTVIKRMRKR